MCAKNVADVFLCLFGVVMSLYFWGLLRTAIWVFPSLFIQGALPVTSASLLSFWFLLAWMAPYFQNAFDFRELSKQRLTIVFFLTGILGGILLFRTEVFYFALCALIPFLLLRIFGVVKHPIVRVYFLPQQWKWILLSFWVIGLGFQVFENWFMSSL